jgi:hypothetical protein
VKVRLKKDSVNTEVRTGVQHGLITENFLMH